MGLGNFKGSLPKAIFSLAIILFAIYFGNSLLSGGFEKTFIWVPVIFLPIAFIKWRETLLIIPFWILVEGMVRKHIHDSVMVLFLKDAALAIVYFRLIFESLSTGRSLLIKNPINIPILCLLLWYILELFNPSLPKMLVGLVAIKVIFFYIPYFYLTRFLFKDKEALFRYLKLYILCLIPVVAMGYYQFITGSDPGVSSDTFFINQVGEKVIRPSATFYYNSNFGQYAFLMFLVLMSLLNIGYFTKRKLLLLSAFVANLVGLLISGQRSAWAAIGAQISFLLILTPVLPKKYASIPKLLFIGLISLLVVLAVLPESYQSFQHRVDATLENPEGGGFLFTYKMERISVKNIIEESPYIGVGPGMATPASRHIIEEEDKVPEMEGRTEGGYVQMWWEIGIIGMLLFLWLLLSLFKYTFSVRKLVDDPDLKPLSVLGTLICSGYMMANVTVGMLNTQSTAIMFWFFLGMMPALPLLDKSPEAALKEKQ